jgi:hypothetical protein
MSIDGFSGIIIIRRIKREVMTMKTIRTIKTIAWVSVLALIALGASCATTSYWGTTNPPIARVKVFNFDESIQIGMTTEINFSITNATDQDLTGLTLAITQNPSDGLELPFTEMTIDRIPAHGTWTPTTPFLVRGKTAGSSAIFFTVTKDGAYLAKDYALVNVGADDDEFPMGEQQGRL